MMTLIFQVRLDNHIDCPNQSVINPLSISSGPQLLQYVEMLCKMQIWLGFLFHVLPLFRFKIV